MSRVAVITGVAGGIGSMTASLFSMAGWRVVGIDIRSGHGVSGLGRFIEADVSDVAASESAFSDIGRTEGRIDGLINNAAIQICKSLLETTPEEWDRVMAVNVRSAYLSARHAHGLLRAEGGAIVNVSSVHAVATSRAMAAYATSKGALTALTRSLALELAGDGIRVNAVLPGAVDTPMLHAGLTRWAPSDKPIAEAAALLGRRHPLGRIAQPQEIAEAILFLADNRRSSFITGQTLLVDGGALAGLSTE